jgi:hypothetical protein
LKTTRKQAHRHGNNHAPRTQVRKISGTQMPGEEKRS